MKQSIQSRKSSLFELNFSYLNRVHDAEEKIFFSLMYIQNKIYNSDKKDDLLRFYSLLGSVDAVTKWMHERPKGMSKFLINHVDDKIIVVIPTMDSNSSYSKECVNNIYKRFTTILVESGVNMYFNFAHNVNAGISKALNFSPDWIIISNDDIYKIDDPVLLKEQLYNLDSLRYKIIYSKYGQQGVIAKYNRFAWLVRSFSIKERVLMSLERRFGIQFRFYLNDDKIRSKIMNFLFISKYKEVKFTGSFFILNCGLLSKKDFPLFDENYINGFEDIDYYVRMDKEKANIGPIDFKIGFIGGKSLGSGEIRTKYKGVLNRIYFNKKITEGKLTLNKTHKE